MEEILTPSEVARLLKVHVNTVYRLAEEGIIPGNKIGRGWRFKKKEVLRLLWKRARGGHAMEAHLGAKDGKQSRSD